MKNLVWPQSWLCFEQKVEVGIPQYPFQNEIFCEHIVLLYITWKTLAMTEHRCDLSELQSASATSMPGPTDHALAEVINSGPSLIHLLLEKNK